MTALHGNKSRETPPEHVHAEGKQRLGKVGYNQRKEKVDKGRKDLAEGVEVRVLGDLVPFSPTFMSLHECELSLKRHMNSMKLKLDIMASLDHFQAECWIRIDAVALTVLPQIFCLDTEPYF